MEIIFSKSDILEAAKNFWREVDGSKVFAFHGEMGAGKTTFIHALCDIRGVQDVVGSPTFSIINEYRYKQGDTIEKLFHIDLYRLKDEQEAIQAGVEDCLYSKNISFVEWPDRAPGIFPDDAVHVYLDLVDSDRRKLRIERN